MDVPLRSRTGEFRYRMLDPKGRPQGKARLKVGPRERGGLRVEWDLAFEGEGQGGYREARTLELDGQWRMAAASYSAMGKPVAKARRDAGRLVGEFFPDGELLPKPLDLPFRDDACTGMQFVFAMFLPHDLGEDGRVSRWLYNEAAAFRADTIESTIHYVREENLQVAGRTVTVHRFLVEDEHGTLPVWVNDRHEIVQVDWGGGNLMVLDAAAALRPAGASPSRLGAFGTTVRRRRRTTRRAVRPSGSGPRA